MQDHKNWPEETRVPCARPQDRRQPQLGNAIPQSARQLRKKPHQLASGAPRARRPQKPARVERAQERQQQPTSAKKRPRLLSQCKSKNRPHQSLRCRPHPKPASPSKLRQTSKASAQERRLFPFRQKQAALPRDYFRPASKTRITSVPSN